MPYQRGAQYGYTVGPQINVRFYLGTDFFFTLFCPVYPEFRVLDPDRLALHCDCISWGGYSTHSGLDIVCCFYL